MTDSAIPLVDCIVVGGVADGTLMREVRSDAQFFKLAKPSHLKPLSSSGQKVPDVEETMDLYEFHLLSLTNTDENAPRLFGVAVVGGHSLSWAFSQLVIGYVENTTAKIAEANKPKIQH